MNKPYIKLYHVIIEIVSFIMFVIAIVFAAIFAVNTDAQIPTHYNFDGEITGYSSPAVLLIFPLIMLPSNIIFSLVVHLMPTSMINIPFKIKPGNELKLYSDTITMVVLIQVIMAIYTLVETITVFASGSMIATIIMVVAMTAAIVGCFIKMYIDNK